MVYKFNIGQNEEISKLCKISNNLYNQALYIFRGMLSKEGKWLSYFELDSIMKNTKNLDGDINYKLLKAQCSQQILRVLDKNIKGYYKSVQDYKKHPNKYKGKPCLPCYRKRGSEFYLCYTNQSCKIKYGKIVLSKSLSIGIPQYEKYSDLIKDFNQVRIKPLNKGYKVEIIYEVKDTETSKERMDKVSSIDLGIDNLVTLVSEDFTYLFSGKFIKSYNKLFNKTLAKLNSIKDLQKIKGTTKRIKKLYYDREQYIEDVFHKISRKIINLLTNSGITKLIVGYNKRWKQGVNMGKRNNQNFVSIPFEMFISMLRYKSERQGLRFVEVNESHTSKCSSFDLESVGHHDTYVGRRVRRGLFKTRDGILINADINGSYNIMRKVKGDAVMPLHTGFGYNPVKKFIN